jgi:hypothetical protein
MGGTGSSINLMYSCVWCGKLKEANQIVQVCMKYWPVL